MPISKKFEKNESISLIEFIGEADRLSNIGCAEGLWSLADTFSMLGNNRDFLSDYFFEYIKSNIKLDPLYVIISQSIVLHRSKNYYIRANFWPTRYECTPEELTLFAYDQPHDHNFDLLSYSYCGEGYYTDNFEYDYNKVIGYQGERVDITPLGRHKHNCGEVMMYFCNKDIHIQHPPNQPSITLNIIPTLNEGGLFDQYFFDIPSTDSCKATIIKRATNSIDQRRMYMGIAKEFYSDNIKDAISIIALKHECPKTRFEALEFIRNIDVDEHERIINLIKDDSSPVIKYYLNKIGFF